MASVLIKNLTRINFLSIAKKAIPIQTCSIIDPKRTFYTQLEKEWIKQNNIKIKEQMKNEKGIEMNFDHSEPQLYFENSEELKNADDVVKKILSLEYASRNDLVRKEEDYLKKVFQNLPIDDESLEIQIAKHTLHIRRMIKHLDECGEKNKRMEFLLYRQFHRRNRLMIELFAKDNARYQFVVEKLNLKDYKLIEKYPYKRQTRYAKNINEIKLQTKEKRLEKLRVLKEEFDRQKSLFYQERERILKEIQEDIRKLVIKPATQESQQKTA